MRVILFALLGLVISHAPVFAGKEGGGGDPLANEYLLIGRLFETTQTREPIPGIDVSGAQIHAKLGEIEASLEGKNPILVFPEGQTIPCFGAPKLGCVADGRIQIARFGWINATIAEKVEVTVMELLLSLGIEDRYGKSAIVARALSQRLTKDRDGFLSEIPHGPTDNTIRACDFETMKPYFERGVVQMIGRKMKDKGIDFRPDSVTFEYLGAQTFKPNMGLPETTEQAVTVSFRTKNGSLIVLATTVDSIKRPLEMDVLNDPWRFMAPEPTIEVTRNAEGFIERRQCVAKTYGKYNRYLAYVNLSLDEYVVAHDLVSSEYPVIASVDLL